MFDQQRSQVHPLERRIDVRDILTGDDDVVARCLVGEVADRIIERQLVRRGVDVYTEGAQLIMGLLWHPLLAEAGDHVDAIAAPIKVFGKETHFRLLSADDEPGEDEQDPGWGRARTHWAT
ncbi:hypothetical protein [Rhizobium sp. L51/94]|uniref:hypothetical protein n=1 Tax=Rhizobium sp. L51/94 TaxID=2819999 RepID=UPI00214AC177|nr:hypothetical protein [Rhizobium sp. L51/94]